MLNSKVVFINDISLNLQSYKIIFILLYGVVQYV